MNRNTAAAATSPLWAVAQTVGLLVNASTVKGRCFQVPNARCPQCTPCTRLGCLDRTPENSVIQVLGEAQATRKWPFAVLGVSPARALLVCGGLAVDLYHWFAPPGIAEEFALGPGFVWGARVLTLSLVGFWLLRGLTTAPPPIARGGLRQ